jgi:hypothetical protein
MTQRVRRWRNSAFRSATQCWSAPSLIVPSSVSVLPVRAAARILSICTLILPRYGA